ncbi:hypothetical protein CHELA1G11_11301 [Hyphomicrobiales bacterium]|nr:hypothetical protein CHELA1G11_11301 [Hyphomicrobiales bacterium]CAH1668724.1 hypothetical protein CHELA1G2_13008 [Hyphomicrobiales bacterium]
MTQRSITAFQLERVTSRKNAAIFRQENQRFLSRNTGITAIHFYYTVNVFYINLLEKIVFIE